MKEEKEEVEERYSDNDDPGECKNGSWFEK
jgi:hypothetical protein